MTWGIRCQVGMAPTLERHRCVFLKEHEEPACRSLAKEGPARLSDVRCSDYFVKTPFIIKPRACKTPAKATQSCVYSLGKYA